MKEKKYERIHHKVLDTNGATEKISWDTQLSKEGLGCIWNDLPTVFSMSGGDEEKMKEEYTQWIELHYPTPKSALKQCEAAVRSMILDFPELTIVKGQAVVEEPHGYPSTKTDHWWCITHDGEVIDPTAHQY